MEASTKGSHRRPEPTIQARVRDRGSGPDADQQVCRAGRGGATQQPDRNGISLVLDQATSFQKTRTTSTQSAKGRPGDTDAPNIP